LNMCNILQYYHTVLLKVSALIDLLLSFQVLEIITETPQ